MRSRWAEARGSVTAEFAVLLPAVGLLLALCLGAVQAAVVQVRLADAAAGAARVLARGDDSGRAAAIGARASPGAVMQVHRDGDVVCVQFTAPAAAGGVLAAIRLRSGSCALAGGW